MTIEHAPQTVAASLLRHLRMKLNDPTHNPNGTPNRMLGWQDGELIYEVNQTLKFLQTLAGNSSADDTLNFVDIAYDEAVEPQGSVLPAVLTDASIFSVHDITIPNEPPTSVLRASVDEVMTYNVTPIGSPAPESTLRRQAQRFCIRPQGAESYIIVRPKPTTGRSYRIWYVAAPLQFDSLTDFVPFGRRWSNLIVLHTYISLVENRKSADELAGSFAQRQNELGLFQRWATAARGPRRIHNARKGARY
jgi:hypothetical protein